MIEEPAARSYSGVSCLSCGQPIPLPQMVLQITRTDQDSLRSESQSRLRVFTLRCWVCEREKPYQITDVVKFEGVPRPRLARSRWLEPAGWLVGRRRRGAHR